MTGVMQERGIARSVPARRGTWNSLPLAAMISHILSVLVPIAVHVVPVFAAAAAVAVLASFSGQRLVELHSDER